MSEIAIELFKNRLFGHLPTSLTESQKQMVLESVDNCLFGLDIEVGTIEKLDTEEILKRYFNALNVQGRSEKTIKQYEMQIKRLIKFADVQIQEITIEHLRAYITSMKEKGLKNSSLENMREVFNAFFNWMHKEGLSRKNIATNFGSIKVEKKVKKIYSEFDIEKIKQNCTRKRDRAVVCFLYSTGCRIGEMTKLNRDDINLSKLECRVNGKGNKERFIYMDAVTGLAIEEYLNERDDNQEALFVSSRRPYNRLKEDGVREILNRIANKCGVEKVHPHKFRRTRATRLIKHGMPIQEVAILLGHEKLDTTMEYVVLDNNDIKNSYNKYL